MRNDYGLFFTRDSTVIRLPVNPEKLPETRGSENDDYNVLGIGPIMIPRTPSLRVVTISSFFPGRTFSGVLTSGGFEDPEFYIQFFRSAMMDCVPILYTPVRYYEDGTPFMAEDTGYQVLVTQFDTEERGGETGDFYYDLELTEYRDYAPQTFQIQQKEGQAAAGTTEPTRQVHAAQLVVGSICIANGNWYYSSYGDEPHGVGNGRRVIVSRIVDTTRKCPVHVVSESGGALGWMGRESLMVVSEGDGTVPVPAVTSQSQVSQPKKKTVQMSKTRNMGMTREELVGVFGETGVNLMERVNQFSPQIPIPMPDRMVGN